MNWLDTIVQGVLLGGLYALFAAGLSLVFGIMRLVNLAHGDLIVLAAFLILRGASRRSGSIPFVAALVAVPVMFARRLGAAVRSCSTARSARTSCRRCWSPSASRSSSRTALLEGFSADSRRIPAGALETASLDLGPVTVGVMPLLTFAVGGRRRSSRSTSSSTAPRSAAPSAPPRTIR